MNTLKDTELAARAASMDSRIHIIDDFTLFKVSTNTHYEEALPAAFVVREIYTADGYRRSLMEWWVYAPTTGKWQIMPLHILSPEMMEVIEYDAAKELDYAEIDEPVLT